MDFIAEARRLVAAIGAQLVAVPQATLDLLREEFDDLPSTYASFLLQVGAGSLKGRFQLYDGFVDPDEVYDPVTAQTLDGIVLFGDDYQGFCVGFLPKGKWQVVEIDPTRGTYERVADSFDAFMLQRLDRIAAST